MKYYATFSCDFGTYKTPEPLVFTNKAKAIRKIKAAIRGYHLGRLYCHSSYIVHDEDGNLIAAGALDNGRWISHLDYIRHTIFNY